MKSFQVMPTYSTYKCPGVWAGLGWLSLNRRLNVSFHKTVDVFLDYTFDERDTVLMLHAVASVHRS